jgi:large subunit ribosomal protein L32
LEQNHYNSKVVFLTEIIMAVPKKKTSKSKRDSRKAVWKRKAAVEAQKALSLGKSVLSGRSNSFVYPQDDEDDNEE